MIMDLAWTYTVAGVVTQGRNQEGDSFNGNQWVMSFSAESSIDGSTYNAIPGDFREGTFQANADRNTKVLSPKERF